MIRKLAAVLLAFSLPLLSVNAQGNPNDAAENENSNETGASDSFWNNFSWAIHGGVIFFTGNPKQGADPSPVIPSLGISAAWNFTDRIRMEVTEDIYISNYEYNTKLGMPLPCNQENRSALAIGLLTGIKFVYLFPIDSMNILIRAYAGPAMDIRIVMMALGLNHPDDFTGNIDTDPRLQTDAIREYFWKDGHWLYGVVGAGIDYPIHEKFLLGLDLRLWVPLSSAEDLRFGIGFRITPRKAR